MIKRILFLLFIVEILFWSFLTHQHISAWLIFWASLLAIFFGVGLIKRSIANVIPQLNKIQAHQLSSMDNTHQHVIVKGVCGVIAGVLLVFPGVLSDVLALLLLLPPVQHLLRQRVMKTLSNNSGGDWIMGMGGFSRGRQKSSDTFSHIFGVDSDQNGSGFNHQSSHQGMTIDGQAREIHKDAERLK